MKKRLVCVSIVIAAVFGSMIGYVLIASRGLDVEKLYNEVHSPITVTDYYIKYAKREREAGQQSWYGEEADLLCEHMTTLNRIRKIWQAKIQYEEEHGEPLPSAYVDADGNKLFSWRVLILPYLGKQRVFEKVHFDKPWWDPENGPALVDKVVQLDSLSEVPRRSIDNTFACDLDLYPVMPKEFESGGSRSPEIAEIVAIQLPDDRKDFILTESLYDVRKREKYKDDKSDKGVQLYYNAGHYADPDNTLTFEQIEDGSFLKLMRRTPLHKDRRFLLCCEQGEFLISADISSKELSRFILEKCCKN